MACGTPLCFFKPLLAVGAIAAIGMGGYNLATTGCPLGTCDAPDQNTTLTSASDSYDAKPMKSDCGSCPSEQQAEQTMLTSLDADTPETTECSEAMKIACEAMGECPEGMMEHCDTAGDCPMGGQTSEASLVADQADGACEKSCDSERECDMPAEASLVADKADGECEKSCDSERECDMPAEQSAEATTETADSTEG